MAHPNLAAAVTTALVNRFTDPSATAAAMAATAAAEGGERGERGGGGSPADALVSIARRVLGDKVVNALQNDPQDPALQHQVANDLAEKLDADAGLAHELHMVTRALEGTQLNAGQPPGEPPGAAVPPRARKGLAREVKAAVVAGVVVLVAAAGVLLYSLTSGDDDTPESVVRSYANAVADNDYREACSYLSDQLRLLSHCDSDAGIAALSQEGVTGEKRAAMRKAKISVRSKAEQEARVVIALRDPAYGTLVSSTLTLRKGDNGHWLIAYISD
ncbi:hypothetical protein J4573_18375 [Actinomadura barringtoniae]|uniref:DUF4878 domain-containing protein n=1 Tax=Actinomadura barringtoniae TaxID=1427535 RepID=A0A939T270_9ACTN|nr:hypothetical protein [Actinomadura barringtoniae]MBO2449076.1 hypothetical protein [Actinomadura barringtoniae]